MMVMMVLVDWRSERNGMVGGGEVSSYMSLVVKHFIVSLCKQDDRSVQFSRSLILNGTVGRWTRENPKDFDKEPPQRARITRNE